MGLLALLFLLVLIALLRPVLPSMALSSACRYCCCYGSLRCCFVILVFGLASLALVALVPFGVNVTVA